MHFTSELSRALNSWSLRPFEIGLAGGLLRRLETAGTQLPRRGLLGCEHVKAGVEECQQPWVRRRDALRLARSSPIAFPCGERGRLGAARRHPRPHGHGGPVSGNCTKTHENSPHSSSIRDGKEISTSSLTSLRCARNAGVYETLHSPIATPQPTHPRNLKLHGPRTVSPALGS
jgi:hypothetical protein